MNLFVVENSFLYYLKSTSSVPVELVNEGSSQESIIAAVADGTDSENSKGLLLAPGLSFTLLN